MCSLRSLRQSNYISHISPARHDEDKNPPVNCAPQVSDARGCPGRFPRWFCRAVRVCAWQEGYQSGSGDFVFSVSPCGDDPQPW